MKFSEAMKLLEEGKKVRRTNWSKEEYMYKNENDTAMTEDGREYDFTWSICGDWEEYIEPTDNTKIEELDVVKCEHKLYNSHAIMGMITENRNKLNEVIRKINKGDKNE